MTELASWVHKSLNGEVLSRTEAGQILAWPEEDLMSLLEAAFQVRQRYFGLKVKISLLQNARSGLCPEDCGYCSQAKGSQAEINKYRLLSCEALVAGADKAVQAGARRYCMVTSGRGPNSKDIDHFSEAVSTIRSKYPELEICLSLGLMNEEQARALKAAGVGWVNHNLNSGPKFYPKICSTHSYQDRVETIRNVKKAGLSTCSGGIVGLGESDEDLLDMALATRELEIDSIPVNFLYPVAGTPMEKRRQFNLPRGLKTLCLMRLLNPRSEVRMAAGRELYLGDKAGLALYPANSIFVEGYLTTPGQQAQEARQLVEAAGFEVETLELAAAGA